MTNGSFLEILQFAGKGTGGLQPGAKGKPGNPKLRSIATADDDVSFWLSASSSSASAIVFPASTKNIAVALSVFSPTLRTPESKLIELLLETKSLYFYTVQT